VIGKNMKGISANELVKLSGSPETFQDGEVCRGKKELRNDKTMMHGLNR